MSHITMQKILTSLLPEQSYGASTFAAALLFPFLISGAFVFAATPGNDTNLSYLESNSTLNIADDDMSKDTLYVREFILAKDVVEREPVDIVDSYAMTDARAWSFARIHNSSVMQDVFFEWYYEDELYFEMNSKIGVSPNWRTYSSVGLQPGSWRVILKNQEGDTLDEIQFHVSE